MFVKIALWFVSHLALTMSLKFLMEEMNFTQTNIATTRMISRLIQEYEMPTVHFINSNNQIIESFLRLHDLNIAIKMENLTKISKSQGRRIGAMLAQLKNYGEFERFVSLIKTELFLYDGYFLIIYENGNLQEIEKIFSKLWKIYIYNVNILVTSAIASNLISMLTYMPFNNHSCNNTKSIQINEFDINSMNWTTNVFFPAKFKDLNRCLLRVGSFINTPAFIKIKTKNGSERYTGSNVDLTHLLSEILNFTLRIEEDEIVMNSSFQNYSISSLLKKVVDNELDFLFGGSLQKSRVEALTATRIIYTDTLVLVIPPPFLIDPLKAIFLPFSLIFWISIGMIVFVAFCIVITLAFTPQIFHDYVIGNNIKGSTLNVWNVLLGGGQKRLPNSNLPRFLLSNYIIFTLIIRTLYQGKIFDILKNDQWNTDVKTIDGFIEHEFTFYMHDTVITRMEGTKIMERLV